MESARQQAVSRSAAGCAAIISAFCGKRSFVRRKISKFAYMNSDWTTATQWCENIIIADADHVDRVAFDLIVNFERMLMRRIPQADMARWLDCVALDGGVREGEEQTQVVLIHGKAHGRMDNFKPSQYDTELDGKAFKDNLGEFTISSLAVENIVSKDDLVCEVLAAACSRKEVKRIMVVPDDGEMYDAVRHTLRRVDDDKRITVFAMQPMPGGNFRQEILGYSLMSALGIRAEELKEE